MNRAVSVLPLLGVLAFVSCSGPEKPDHSLAKPPPAIVGTWRSFEYGGKDLDDSLVWLREVYNTDWTCTIAAKLNDGSGLVVGELNEKNEITYRGTYSLLPGRIQVTLPDLGTEDRLYTLEDGVLTIRSLQWDSWVRFRKD